VPPEQREALEKTMEKMEQASQPETWFDGSKVNDVLFCEDFLAGHPMKCIHGTFFDINGAIGDAEQIKAEIYYKIAPYVTSGIAKKATTLLDALRIRCYSPPLPFQTDRIHVANGTYFLSGDFSTQKEFCMNRLPVKYLPGAPEPSRWLAFLGQLLVPEDIITLQEFMGYVLLPTTKGQKMMIVIGKGGEGKSRIGRVLRALLGDSMNTGSIQKVEVDRFATLPVSTTPWNPCRSSFPKRRRNWKLWSDSLKPQKWRSQSHLYRKRSLRKNWNGCPL
jgi:putative DNA primase/helicase